MLKSNHAGSLRQENLLEVRMEQMQAVDGTDQQLDLSSSLVLQEFFGVTQTSIYRVVAQGEDGRPLAEKVASRGNSKIFIGQRIRGPMLAVAKQLQFYVPEGHSLIASVTTFERRLEEVNTHWWGAHTSDLVALFMSERAARQCFATPLFQFCDPRWHDDTRAVLAAIGDDHPTITVCRFPTLALFPNDR